MLPNERKRTLSDAELRSMSRADLEMLVRECVSRSRSTSADATASEPGPAPVKQEYVMTFDSKMKPTKTPPARRAMTEEEKRDTKMMRSRGACTRCKGQKKRCNRNHPLGPQRDARVKKSRTSSRPSNIQCSTSLPESAPAGEPTLRSCSSSSVPDEYPDAIFTPESQSSGFLPQLSSFPKTVRATAVTKPDVYFGSALVPSSGEPLDPMSSRLGHVSGNIHLPLDRFDSGPAIDLSGYLPTSSGPSTSIPHIPQPVSEDWGGIAFAERLLSANLAYLPYQYLPSGRSAVGTMTNGVTPDGSGRPPETGYSFPFFLSDLLQEGNHMDNQDPLTLIPEHSTV